MSDSRTKDKFFESVFFNESVKKIHEKALNLLMSCNLVSCTGFTTNFHTELLYKTYNKLINGILQNHSQSSVGTANKQLSQMQKKKKQHLNCKLN